MLESKFFIEISEAARIHDEAVNRLEVVYEAHNISMTAGVTESAPG